jgi:uncharacterized protein (DUF2252 family)
MSATTVTPPKSRSRKKEAAAERTPPRSERKGTSGYPSVEERIARGRAARERVPRSSHAKFKPAPNRADPIALLEEQGANRVPELVPIRYGRMLVSPFTFYRGAALIMADDLAASPHSDITAQLCGDAHLSNFGAFASAERRLVFDINDFDETLPGPWEWDVKRLAASFAVAGRDNGFTKSQRSTVVLDAIRQYREAMNEFAEMRNLDVWYSRLELQEALEKYRSQVDAKSAKRAEANIAKARTRDSVGAYSKLTRSVEGEVRFASNPPLLVPMDELIPDPAVRHTFVSRIEQIINTYRRTLQADRRSLLEQFEFVDLARKVVGVGSVGTRAWVVLMLGRDGQDPLFLQVKEAQRSVLEQHTAKSAFQNQGERVVSGQRLIQESSDIFLGWLRAEGIDFERRDFYVRQLRDWKMSAEIETMPSQRMSVYGRMCGWTLARAHARSGDRIAIASYLGKSDAFDRALATFAERYADQTERDHEELEKAVKEGRITAETGI